MNIRNRVATALALALLPAVAAHPGGVPHATLLALELARSVWRLPSKEQAMSTTMTIRQSYVRLGGMLALAIAAAIVGAALTAIAIRQVAAWAGGEIFLVLPALLTVLVVITRIDGVLQRLAAQAKAQGGSSRALPWLLARMVPMACGGQVLIAAARALGAPI